MYDASSFQILLNGVQLLDFDYNVNCVISCSIMRFFFSFFGLKILKVVDGGHCLPVYGLL